MTAHQPHPIWAAKLRVARGALALTALTLVVSCGLTYNSPSVRDDIYDDEDALNVSIVAMTPETISRANSTPYTPRDLPPEFDRSVGASGGLSRAPALPTAPFIPEQTRERLDFRPLPDARPEQYRIGIGDVLLLATRGNATTVEELSGLLAAQNRRQGYTVRDDGSIAIPEIGSVDLAGLTLQEAEDRVFQVLVENQIDPAFSLEVAEFNSRRVTVGGAVGQPNVLPITPIPLTLGEAIVAAGDISVTDEEFASIRVYRDGTLYQIPVERYLKSQDLRNKVLLNGDAVFVDTTYNLDRALQFYETQLDVISLRSNARSDALQLLNTEINIQRAALQERRQLFLTRNDLGAVQRDYVYLAGEVNQQSRFPLPFEQHATLADVLYSEGGFDTLTGDPTQIYVLRLGGAFTPGAQILAYHLDAANAASLVFATRFQMRPDDVLFIEEQPITKWNRSFQQFFPTVVNAVRTSL